MWNIGPYSDEGKSLPFIVYAVCLYFLLSSLVSLYIVLSIWSPIPGRPYYIAESMLVIAACNAVILNNKWATRFVFLGALALTIGDIFDFPYELHRHAPLTLHALLPILHLLTSVALYWAAFLWYRNWRIAQPLN
jgi:hypothetical protein